MDRGARRVSSSPAAKIKAAPIVGSASASHEQGGVAIHAPHREIVSSDRHGTTNDQSLPLTGIACQAVSSGAGNGTRAVDAPAEKP